MTNGWSTGRFSSYDGGRRSMVVLSPGRRFAVAFGAGLAIFLSGAGLIAGGFFKGTVDRPVRVEYSQQRLLVSAPCVVGFRGRKALVEFDTLRPCPPVCIDYGVDDLGGRDFLGPKFRKRAYERGTGRGGDPVSKTGDGNCFHHVVKLDVSRLEHKFYGPELIAEGGGAVVFQLQAYDSESQRMVLREGRFAYRRQGAVAEGRYELVTAIVAGPFIDKVSDKSAVVSWDTDRPSRGSVMIGVSGKSGRRSVVEAGGVGLHHEVVLEDLSPSTCYEYTVLPGGRGFPSGPFRFRTAPAPGADERFSFVFMSDGRNGDGPGRVNLTGCNVEVISRLLNSSYRAGAAFVLFGGDLVNGYTSDPGFFNDMLLAFKQGSRCVGARIPVYEVVGNHEEVAAFYRLPDFEYDGKWFLAYRGRRDPLSVCSLFSAAFVNPVGSAYGLGEPARERRKGVYGPAYAETVYSFRYANCLFIVLNSNYWNTAVKGAPGSSRKFSDTRAVDYVLDLFGGNREGYIMDGQLEWLRRELEAAERDTSVDHVFVALHEPPYPCGGHLGDAMYWNGRNDDGPLGDVLDRRDAFIGLLSGCSKVRAVLTGDEHNYSRLLIDGALSPKYRGSLWQIISGGAGAPYYRKDPSLPWASSVKAFAPSVHYCLFTVEGSRVSLVVKSDDGRILDEVSDFQRAR